VKRLHSQQSGRDALQQANRPHSEEAINHHGGGDVEDAAQQPSPKDAVKAVGLRLG